VGLARKFLKDSSGVRFDNEPGTYDKNEFIPVEVKAGSLVLLDGNLVHQRCTSKSDHFTSLIVCLILELIITVRFRSWKFVLCKDGLPNNTVIRVFLFPYYLMRFFICSFENTSPKSRQAYSVHVVETKDCIWAEQNW